MPKNASDVTFIFAHGSNWKAFHDAHGSVRLDLRTGKAEAVVSTSRRHVYALHGSLMISTWLAAVPAASLAARALRFLSPKWFYVHLGLHAAAALWFVYALTLVLGGDGDEGEGEGEDEDARVGTHEALGLTVLVLWCVQVTLGMLRPDAHGAVRLGFVPPTWRRAFVAVHRVLAAALVALAGANCILGAILLESTFGGGGPTLAAAIALLVLWALAWVAAEALGLPGRKAAHGEYSVARADGAQFQPNPLSDIPGGL